MRVMRIDLVSNIVLNAELWDSLPSDPAYVFVSSDTAHIGDVYDPVAKTFTTPPVVQPVPEEISMLQARMALARAGLLSQVQAAVDAAPANSDVAIYWEYAASLHRDHPVVAELAAAVSLTSDQVDDLFRQAAAIT